MTADLIIQPLTPAEKQQLLELESIVQESFVRMADALVKIKKLKLYRESGTWEDYCQTRFHFTASRSRQIILGALIAREVEDATGIIVATETAARLLKTYGDQAVQVAIETQVDGVVRKPYIEQWEANRQQAESATQVTVKTAPDDAEYRRLVYASDYAPVSQAMDSGRLTPKAAYTLSHELKASAESVRRDMLKYGVMSDSVVKQLNIRRHTDGYAEIIRTGYLQFGDGTSKRLIHASGDDVTRFFTERSREHQIQRMVERDAAIGVRTVELTLRLNDAAWSADMLVRMMGERNAREIARIVLQQTGIASHAAVHAAF